MSRQPTERWNTSQSPGSRPFRQTSIGSTASSAYSGFSMHSNGYPPSRTSTVSSSASSAYSQLRKVSGHKRGISETSDMASTGVTSIGGSPENFYRNVRQSLRPLPQAPSSTPPTVKRRTPSHQHVDRFPQRQSEDPFVESEDKVTPVASPRSPPNGAMLRLQASSFVAPDIQELKKSSTNHLRTLSKFAQSDDVEEYGLTKPAASVVGLHNRRQLKRTDSPGHGTGQRTFGFERNWMDKQRQFLQAYEYLCHVGEAKEWIEDIIQQPIPPIVELEEALRDGVTLAEIVQTFHPNQKMKIFRNEKLQYKHSDNIVLFFRFLEEVELPELFRFELIDLYEKKNIPKVIYCIHALSWLLYRKGMVDFRIGNLIGRLQFEHHELEKTQKGLDKAGVSMPSFQGMGASFGAEPEPEPEPVETEEERIDRELVENEDLIIDFQNQIRGAMVRLKLGDTMNGLWDAEPQIIELQSMIRADWARQVIDYRLSMKQFATQLQAASRGFVVRQRQSKNEQQWRACEQQVLKIQSVVRARKVRAETKKLKTEMRKADAGIKVFQAALRGALTRQSAARQDQVIRENRKDIVVLQSSIRAMLARQRVEVNMQALYRNEETVNGLQSAVRGFLSRSKQTKLQNALGVISADPSPLQSFIRGMRARQNISLVKRDLRSHVPAVILIQSWVRGANAREEHHALKLGLLQSSSTAHSLQNVLRGFMTRQRISKQQSQLRNHALAFTQMQSIARGALLRIKIGATLNQIEEDEEQVIKLQGLIRAMLRRSQVATLLDELDQHDESISHLQAAIRGRRIRAGFLEKKRFFKENMEKVVKIQSVVRAKIQGQAYKSLTSGKNPPVGTLKGFVHLLNDSNFDFNEEIEIERLRKAVVQNVRQNELADQYIQQLDIKIALLVKNKITLDEVVKHQRHFGGLVPGSDFSHKDPFDLKALNKTSRNKLEHYQELFFLLQTQPYYLAKFFRRMREQGTAEKECERIKHLVMGLFGYAQKRREEYYLVKLITRSVKEEIDCAGSLQDYLRANSFCHKLFAAYSKSPKDRKFFRDVLGGLVKEHFIDQPDLDLESDPIQIYRSAINNEELRTGQRSRRNPEIPREEAIRDPETRATFIAHMQDLRDISDHFFAAIEEYLHRMPFGVRCVAQQTHEFLLERFPGEDPALILQFVGHWIWRSYLQPALLEPEKSGVTDRAMTQEQKRNLSEVAKVLNQAASGREFGGENVYLQPLNNYIKESIQRFRIIWTHVVDISSPEQYYDIDEFNDLYAKTKPTLFIKMADIFSIHQIVSSEIDHVCPTRDDVLRETLRELGNVKSNETEFMSVSTGEITLTLTPRYLDAQDPDAEVKALFTETKRCVLYIIRVQTGANLLDILIRPISPEDERKWDILVKDELLASDGRRVAYAEATNILDISTLNYPELKRIALENVLQLEHIGRLTRSNNFQDLLNAIAVDIRTKSRRRLQRQRELEGVKTTLARLNEQTVYLDQQLKTYNDYIEQAMVTLQSKKGKKRFLLPFTKQYNHERELQRSGKSFKFGSYKYSARTLADKGVLVHWRGYLEHQWHRVDVTISSNEVGLFTIDGSSGNMMIPGASAQVPLDDLLQAQFNNTQYMEFFEGKALRVNVNLFLHLIMRKFYNE